MWVRVSPHRVVISDLRVKVDVTGLCTYPDLLVVCGEPRFEDDLMDTLLNPLAIVEVLSDSTEKYDRGEKFAPYRHLPSVQEYVLVAQDRPLVERYIRQPDDTWVLTVFGELTGTFTFNSFAAQIPLADISRGGKLSEIPNR